MAAADIQRAFHDPDQARTGQPGQDLGLISDPCGGGIVDRYLQHPGGLRAGTVYGQVGDQQADRGGASAETTDKFEPAVDDFPRSGIERIIHFFGRAGQGLLRVGQPLQERPHVWQPFANRRPSRLQDQCAHGRGHLRQVSR